MTMAVVRASILAAPFDSQRGREESGQNEIMGVKGLCKL